MAALDTVAEYITAARMLLQDTISPYRVPDADLLTALNLAFIEAKRLRPDMFLSTSLPEFSTNDSTAVSVDEAYRAAFLFYMTGWVQLRDEEDTQDARAGEFLKRFSVQLGGIG